MASKQYMLIEKMEREAWVRLRKATEMYEADDKKLTQGGKVMTKKELKSIETLERRAAEKLEESERVFGKMNTVTISDRAYWAGIRAALETLKEGKL